MGCEHQDRPDIGRTTVIIVLGLLIASAPAVTAEGDVGTYDILVKSWDEEPEEYGDFATFGVPALNDSGQAAFYATLEGGSIGDGDNEGIYRGSGLGITRIEREFSKSTVSLTNLSQNPAIDTVGRVAYSADFWATAIGVPRNELRCSNGTATAPTVAYVGQSVPGGSGNFASFDDFVLGRGGHMAFHAKLSSTISGIHDDEGVYRATGSYILEIAREGETSPDGDGVFGSISNTPRSLWGPAINDVGEVAFRAGLKSTSNSRGVYIGQPGSVATLMRANDPLPGPGEMSQTWSYGALPVTGSSGRAAFAFFAQNTGSDHNTKGIYFGERYSGVEVFRHGDLAPDSNGTFVCGWPTVESLAVNSSGRVAFPANLNHTAGSTNDDFGLFIGYGGEITQIARKGQPAPDGNGVFSTIGDPALNDANVVAFRAEFSGTSDGEANNAGIYLSDGVEIVSVARKGQMLLESTITDLDFRDSTDINGPTRSGLNESTQVAYRATLADGRQAIVLFTPDIHWRAGASGAWTDKSNWTLGLAPGRMYDTLIDPASGLNVTGPAADTTIKSLRVGSTGSGRAVLDLSGQSNLTALGSVTIEDRGEIRVGAGQVLTASGLHNYGILSGDGQVDAQLFNYSGAEVRVSSGQRLEMTNSISGINFGEIEVIGGQIEFDASLVNSSSTGLIACRNGVLRFNGGLTNDGSLVLSFGTSDVHGEILNTHSEPITVTGNSEATFYDDISNFGVIQVSGGSTAVFFGDLIGNGVAGTGDVFLEGDTRPGFSPGEMNFGGDVAFGPLASLEIELGGTVPADQYDTVNVAGTLTPGGVLQVSLVGQFAPQPGDTFDILDWGSLVDAEFGAIELPELAGRKTWDTSGLYVTGQISVIAMLDGDTDVDWDVDLVDYDAFKAVLGSAGDWRTDFNEDGQVDLVDFALMRANFGVGVESSPGPAPDATVPEPATIALLGLGALAVIRRRRFHGEIKPMPGK